MDEFRQTEYIGWNDLRESQTVRRIRLRESQTAEGWMS
jgi:hypothetical protein